MKFRRFLFAVSFYISVKSDPTLSDSKMRMRSLTIFRRSIVGLVDGEAETLVGPPPPDNLRPRAVEGHLGLAATLLGLRHGRLETLKGAGLPQAQGRAQRSIRGRI